MVSLSAGGSSSSATLAQSAISSNAISRTRRPIVTGTSVLGIVYKDGVMLSADTLCSYGTMAKYKDARRLVSVNSQTLIGGSGEYSDFQSIIAMLKQNALENKCLSDSLYEEDQEEEHAPEIWSYLRAVMYQRRNKMNPLWNDLLVAGYTSSPDGPTPFLGSVDKIGTAFTDNYIATGFGAYLAMPLLREKWRPDLEEGEARALLEDCMRVLFYRDCRALNKIQIAKVEKGGSCLVSDPYEIETHWESASFSQAKADLSGDGGW